MLKYIIYSVLTLYYSVNRYAEQESDGISYSLLLLFVNCPLQKMSSEEKRGKLSGLGRDPHTLSHVYTRLDLSNLSLEIADDVGSYPHVQHVDLR